MHMTVVFRSFAVFELLTFLLKCLFLFLLHSNISVKYTNNVVLTIHMCLFQGSYDRHLGPTFLQKCYNYTLICHLTEHLKSK